MRDAILGKEHVLSAAQADAFGAELASLLGIARDIRIGAHTDFPEWLRPVHKFLEFRQILRVRREQLPLASQHTAGRAVDRDPVAIFEHLSSRPHFSFSLVDGDLTSAGDATFTHATS